MKIKTFRTVQAPSLILAAALQVFPIARATLPAAGATANVLAIIFRWAVGAAAVGAVDAVSGASTFIATPLSTNITEGKSFSVRLVTAPYQSYFWTVSALPPGLTLGGWGGASYWEITGTPTATGTYNVDLTASDVSSYPANRTIHGTLVINIAPPPVIQPIFSTLTVLVNGQGSVSPNYNGQSLQVGSNYTMTATPGPGFYFTNWTGGLKTNSATLSFVMKSNLVWQANFLFPFVKGVYRGLCYDPNGVTSSNAGAFTVTTTTAGKYSGSLVLAGKKFGLSGKFNIFGNTSNRISLNKSNAALVSLALDNSDTDRITGSVSNAFWFVPMSADRATFNATINPAPQRGNYTLMVPGAGGSTNSPAGTSFGTLKIDAAGNVTFAGMLADGTKISQGTAVSKDGFWPLYVPLYSGSGLVFGWQLFTNALTDDVSGPLCWIKAAQPKSRYYPAGFAFIPSLSGSVYLAPTSGVPALNLQSSDLWFAGGGLSQSYTNLITILPNNRATNIAGVKLALTVAPKTGLFTGSFVNPETTRSVLLRGVILQKQNLGAGFFLSTNLSGEVYF